MIIKCWDAICTSIAYILYRLATVLLLRNNMTVLMLEATPQHALTSTCMYATNILHTECSNTVCWIKSGVRDRDALHPFPLNSMELLTRNDHVNCTVRFYAIHMRISCDLRCFRWCAGRAYCIFAYAMALASVWLFSHSVNICWTRWNDAPQIWLYLYVSKASTASRQILYVAYVLTARCELKQRRRKRPVRRRC